MIYNLVIFPAGFAGQGALNKDPSVWLDGAWPANTLSSRERNHTATRHNHPNNYI